MSTLATLRKMAAALGCEVWHERESERYRCQAPDGMQFEEDLTELVGDYSHPGATQASARVDLADSLEMYTELEVCDLG